MFWRWLKEKNLGLTFSQSPPQKYAKLLKRGDIRLGRSEKNIKNKSSCYKNNSNNNGAKKRLLWTQTDEKKFIFLFHICVFSCIKKTLVVVPLLLRIFLLEGRKGICAGARLFCGAIIVSESRCYLVTRILTKGKSLLFPSAYLELR